MPYYNLKGSAILTVVIWLAGCSTSPPNLSQGLLTQQNDKQVFVFNRLDFTSNLGKKEFDGTEKVLNDNGDSVVPTYSSIPTGGMYSVIPIKWVLISLYLNGFQPGVAVGLDLENWSSVAYIPTYSFVENRIYSAYQFNQKIFKYAAISFTKYEEQLISHYLGQAYFDFRPVKRISLNELAINLSIKFDLFGFPVSYSILPKYTWSKNGEIRGGGFSSVIGFDLTHSK